MAAGTQVKDTVRGLRTGTRRLLPMSKMFIQPVKKPPPNSAAMSSRQFGPRAWPCSPDW